MRALLFLRFQAAESLHDYPFDYPPHDYVDSSWRESTVVIPFR